MDDALSLLPPDLEANRGAEKAERFAQTVLQKSLVREVQVDSNVREECEGRRRHADLRAVENAHRLFSRAGNGMLGGDGLEKTIQFGRRNAAAAESFFARVAFLITVSVVAKLGSVRESRNSPIWVSSASNVAGVGKFQTALSS